MGRLTNDPKVKATTNINTEVTNITLVVNRKYVPKGKEKIADFFNLVAYGKTAEFINKYLKKGQQVLVEGRMQNRTWEDQTGVRRYATDYIVEQIYFADSKREGDMPSMDQSNGVPNSSSDGVFITIDDNDELPF